MSTLFRVSTLAPSGKQTPLTYWNGDYEFADLVAEHIVGSLEATEPWEEIYELHVDALGLFSDAPAVATALSACRNGERLIICSDCVWMAELKKSGETTEIVAS